MADLTLGLDLGANSIGWALIDEAACRIAAAGVRIFPEGVDRDQKGGEVSKSAARRLARQMRRQILRRARRKRRLRAILVRAGLLPPETPPEWWAAEDPYILRRRALDARLEPHEIGRLLVHLNQRRGFRPSSKADRRQKKSDLKGMLGEIGTLASDIEQADHRSLGEHLASLRADPHVRIRGRHTSRDMFEKEFDSIWAVQRIHHPDLLTDDLRDRVRKTIYYQRPLRIPRQAIGMCELEPKRRRCPRADRLAQRFRMLQQLNDLRLIDAGGQERGLTEAERSRLLEPLARRKDMKFDGIRKRLGLFEGTVFNYQRGEREKLDGMATDAALASSKLFGKRWWELPEDAKNAVVRSLLDDEDAVIRRRAAEEWGLDEEATKRLLRVDLQAGYARFSREALSKLLPQMEAGLPLMAPDDEASAMSEAGYLRPDQRSRAARAELPQPPAVANPIVRQGLHEVHKVVNAIIREYGKPARIRIELAREVKGSAEQRRRRTLEMSDRRREREAAKAAIEEAGQRATHHFIERYLLWREQNELCIYSGRPIRLAQLLGPGGEVHVDHVLPYPRSLDDSLGNKVVCFREANVDKLDRTPYEWLAEREPRRYEELLQRARRLPYGKYRRFTQKAVELEEFINRQLTDTAYISREVRDYVRYLGVDVVCTTGQHTAELRRRWGLNTILHPDGTGEKNRADHRHHAIDAVVVGLMDRSRLQQLARGWRAGRLTIDDPWQGFRQQVEQAVQGIIVSHRVQRKVAGALHQATVYAATPRRGVFAERKKLEDLTLPMVNDIRDKVIRNVVKERLREFGLDPNRKGAPKIPEDVWAKPLTMKSGRQINRVRVLINDETIRPVRQTQDLVKPGRIHHVSLFEYTDETGRLRRDADFLSMIDAAARAQAGLPLIAHEHSTRKDAKFIMSFSANEVLLVQHHGREDLYTFETGASTTKQMWFRHHTASGKSGDKKFVISKKPNTLQARKVVVDPLGRVRRAND